MNIDTYAKETCTSFVHCVRWFPEDHLHLSVVLSQPPWGCLPLLQPLKSEESQTYTEKRVTFCRKLFSAAAAYILIIILKMSFVMKTVFIFLLTVTRASLLFLLRFIMFIMETICNRFYTSTSDWLFMRTVYSNLSSPSYFLLWSIVLFQVDDGTTGPYLPSGVEVGASAFPSRPDVSPRVHYIHIL